MRITSQMCQKNSINNLTGSFAAAIKYNDHVMAERQVLELKDNPASAITGLKMANLISRTEQYQENIKLAVSSLNLADSKMGTIKGLLDEAVRLLNGAATESTTPDERRTNAVELNDILKQIIMNGNSMNGLRYLFGGTNSTTEPFTMLGKYVKYNGNNQGISVQTGKNSSATANASASDAFGNLTSTVSSGSLKAGVNMGSDTSTSLAALNNGSGVPQGKIKVYYSAYPDGLEVDLSGCDTLEDVKDTIEKATLEASRNLDPSTNAWLDGGNLDWRDLQDRYVKVTMNPNGNGISLQEMDLGEPLPRPTAKEIRNGLDYSGQPGYTVGGGGTGIGAGTVYDKNDVIYGNGSGTYAALRVDEVAGNKVAAALGIKGTANAYDASSPDAKLDGFIHGGDLKPKITKDTLLADLEGYNDGVYTITNGDKPGAISIKPTTSDPSHVFNNWKLNNLSKGDNTGPNGELYTRVTRRGSPDNDLYVEVFAVPLDQAKASDLVASGSYTQSDTGGTVVLNEANGSGVTGTVGIHLPTTIDSSTVNLQVEWEDSLSDTVHVPAFVEQKNPNGTSKDYLNLLSGWNITGLDKPPAGEYDLNHPPSTDPDGNVSVNLRMVQDPATGTTKAILELYRPAYNGQPAALVATGELELGALPLDTAVSGRIAIEGIEGFEAIGGSVYFELPAGTQFGDGTIGSGQNSPTSLTYQLPSDMEAGVEFTLGGAMTLAEDQTLGADLTLKEKTELKSGTIFTTDVTLPNGEILTAGQPLPYDTVFPKGTVLAAGTQIAAGTVLTAGHTVTFADGLKQGTVLPAGSYTTDPSKGFPADGMMSTYAAHAGEVMGFNLQATFATVEDFMRAVEELDIHVSAQISADGNKLEFVSHLAGDYLTVSEDLDCYEQMNDKYQQLSGLDLNGLIQGVNTDSKGDVHTEVVFYPPDPTRTDGKVVLLSADGEQVLVDAGYYVRVYSDADALKQNFADRDNSSLVAEGFVPAGTWDNTDPNNPYIPAGTVGTALPMILEERNDSGISGSVNFDYYGGRDQADLTLDADKQYSPYNNSQITVSPGGLRTTSSVHTTIQEVDITGFTPGVHADYSGTAHASIGWDQASGTTTVSVYRDSSRSSMSAKGEMNAKTGEVTLYETDAKGNYRLDANGDRIKLGSMVVPENSLNDGQVDNFTITMGGLDYSGQEREDNLFATINDIMEAMNDNDVETLHNLVDKLAADVTRLIDARGEVSSRSEKLTLLSERYAEDIISYNETFTTTVGMDADATLKFLLLYQSAENQYNAAMTLSSRYLNMSLLDYL